MEQPAKTLRDISCADDYDPDSLPVETARTLIRTLLRPVETRQRVHIRESLSRVLAQDVIYVGGGSMRARRADATTEPVVV